MKAWHCLTLLLAFLAINIPFQQPLRAQSSVMPRLQRNCEAGNSEDCFTLAQNYGVMSGLRTQCNRGDDEACAKLKQDYPVAIADAVLIQKYNFYRDRACTLGSEEVCRQIGNSYQGYSWATGTADERKALYYYSRACQIDSSSRACEASARLSRKVNAETTALRPTQYDQSVFLDIETMAKRYIYSRFLGDDYENRYVTGSLSLGAAEGDRQQRGIIHFTVRLQTEKGEIMTRKMNAIYEQGRLRCVDDFDVKECRFTYLTQEMADRQHANQIAHRERAQQAAAAATRATSLKLPGARLSAEDRACIASRTEQRSVSIPRCTSTEVDPSSHEPYCASTTYVEGTKTVSYKINQCKRPLYFVFKCGSTIVDNGPTQPGQRLKYENSYCDMVYPDKK